MSTKAQLLRSPWVQLAACIAIGLLFRISRFGDPNVHADESFYLLVGHEMHLGALPYVDIWDRKPLGLFITYWLFTFFPNSVLAYQIGAWLFASLTAFVISRIAARWLPPAAAVAGGVLYLALLGSLLGAGGQSPVFYSLFVATGALLVIQFIYDDAPIWRLYAAMLLLGIAITYKQTAAFESAFFGLAAAFHHRSLTKTTAQILIGAAPFSAMAAWYLIVGHWDEFYGAMVTANTVRSGMDLPILGFNSLMLCARLGPLAGLVIYAYAFCRHLFPAKFMALWLLAATVGFFSVPFVIEHYAIPLLVPLCVVGATIFVRRPHGPWLVAFVAASGLLLWAPFNFALHRRSAAAFDSMVRAIGPIPRGRILFIYDGPPLLYHAVGVRPPSILAFPGHLDNLFEKDVSHIPTVPELERIIAARPYAVVMAQKVVTPANGATFSRLVTYLRTQCPPPAYIMLWGPFGEPSGHFVYSRCAMPGARPSIQPAATPGGG